MKRLITIVIPVYNGSPYLAEAIDSALAQTHPPLEIIVVNDGSNDGGATQRIASSYADRIRYIQKPNGGVASALNAAIRESRGDYISWLSHDDLYTPDKLERQLSTLEALPVNQRDQTVIYSDFSIFYDGATQNQGPVIRLAGRVRDPFRFWLTLESSLHGCTLLIPRRAFEECGMFNESLRHTQDYDFWFRLAAHYDFVHTPSVLVRSRVHQGQDSVKLAGAALAECIAMEMGFLDELSVEELSAHGKRSVAQGYALLATGFIRRGYTEPAKKALSLALQQPSSKMERISLCIGVIKARIKHHTLILLRRLIPMQLRRLLRSLF